MTREVCKNGHSLETYGFPVRGFTDKNGWTRKPYVRCRQCQKKNSAGYHTRRELSEEERAACQAKVPLEPVKRRVFAYLKEYGWDPNEKWEAWRFPDGDISPLYPFAEKAGILHDTLDGLLKAKNREYVFFDMADKLLCAIWDPFAWYEDDLVGWYAVASAAADRRFPIKEAT